jgi:hypothetical protein
VSIVGPSDDLVLARVICVLRGLNLPVTRAEVFAVERRQPARRTRNANGFPSRDGLGLSIRPFPGRVGV